MKSSFSGFYKLSPQERLAAVVKETGISEEDAKKIAEPSLPVELADKMVENVIGTYTLPMGVALNFIINGKDVIIPMVTEEPSVIAAASNSAKMARMTGGFTTSFTGPIMIAQVQIVDVPAPEFAKSAILQHKEDIKKICNDKDPVLVKFGGGFHDLDVRIIETKAGTMLILHLLVNVGDAMGANAVNSMAEAVAPYVEQITGGKVYLRILSNLATYRLARASAVYKKESLSKTNKGIMNGITAAVLATGNDTRAIESGAHSYAAIKGRYTSLTVWEKDANGDLVGTIEVPMAVGLVGGATKTHPGAQAAVKILGVKTAAELAQIYAAVGLAQNLAAIKALATEGIQRGHMKLHARTVAASVGAEGEVLEEIVKTMIRDKNVNAVYAKELMEKFS